MKTLLRTQRFFCAILIFFCTLVSNLHSFGTSGVLGIEVSNIRPIRSNNGFFKSNRIQEKHANFETTKPLPFVIPSYASGILKSRPIASNVSPPSQFLLPPIVTNVYNADTTTKSFSTTILNSNEPETTTTLLPLTQRFSSSSVTQRSNFDGKIDTIQPKPFASTQKPSSFTPSIPKTSFQFNIKSTTPPPPLSKTTITATTTTKTTATFHKFGEFEKSTFGLGFRQSRRDDEILDILGNQKPGYAIRPDGSIDSEALPQWSNFDGKIQRPKFIQDSSTKFTTEIPTTTVTISRNSSPTKPTTTTITTKLIATTKVSKNFTHNPWLQQATPFHQITFKPFIPSTTFTTTTDFPLETTTQSFFKGISQFPNGIVAQFGGSSPKPFNMIKKTTTQNAVTQKPDFKPQSINSSIQLPNSNLLPPQQENTQLSISLETTTTLPLKKFPTIFTTFSSTVPTTVPMNTQDQPTSSIQHQHKSPAITLPSIDLLPPRTANFKAHTITNEAKPNDFLPQLDLNPFLAPFLGSTQNSNESSSKTTTSPPLQTTTIKNSQMLLQDSPFSYKKPAVPFIIQANVHGSAQQQPFQPNIKYTGSFGAPPGILTPYDNLG
ncbi:mucin-3A-like [Contarinia nasturtii]|uniref:mucin-3A-like n=1 Tax=Contarinia nasturtii TaxID=265458 RepID=UPI0012D46261|nr:mucin-3A-like [Contarinia nasturtii]